MSRWASSPSAVMWRRFMSEKSYDAFADAALAHLADSAVMFFSMAFRSRYSVVLESLSTRSDFGRLPPVCISSLFPFAIQLLPLSVWPMSVDAPNTILESAGRLTLMLPSTLPR